MNEPKHIAGPHEMRIAHGMIGLAQVGYMHHGYIFSRKHGQQLELSDAEHETARLYVAAYNAFDSAAKRLGVNAVELAERMADGDLLTGLIEVADNLANSGEDLRDQISTARKLIAKVKP